MSVYRRGLTGEGVPALPPQTRKAAEVLGF